MPDRVVSSSKLTAIADAIRTKAGTQNSMTLDEMPTAIANIPSGGGDIDLTGYTGSNWCDAVAPLLDTSGMTDMSYMFANQRTATSIDVTNLNTTNVTDMHQMFSNCENLQTIDLASFNTSQVTTMANMFDGCRNLRTINNLSALTTTNVTNMNSMFYTLAYEQANNAIALDLSTFRTSNVTRMSLMFYNASLRILDLDNWNTSSVTNMSNMFSSAFPYGGKIWVPSTFVATAVSSDSNKPFYASPIRNSGQVHVYTNASSATRQGWGTINAAFTMHYGTTHQAFLNA